MYLVARFAEVNAWLVANVGNQRLEGRVGKQLAQLAVDFKESVLSMIQENKLTRSEPEQLP